MTGTPTLTIRIKKNADGSAALTCLRADGSVTWQRQQGRQGLFFPRHDLTHFAVETELGFRRGFYGLVAEGWDISDFGAPWPRGRIPADAEPAELIVGFFDMERAAGTTWRADDFNDKAAAYFRDHRITGTPPSLTDDQIDRVRARMRSLFARWDAIAPGGSLELLFEPPNRVAR